MESRVQLVAYVPAKLSKHLPDLACFTSVRGVGYWRGMVEAVDVTTIITTQTHAEEIATYIYERLIKDGEQEVLITINPVTVWSPQ